MEVVHSYIDMACSLALLRALDRPSYLVAVASACRGCTENHSIELIQMMMIQAIAVIVVLGPLPN